MNIINTVADSLPQAWQDATIACWEFGSNFKTQYDKDIDPPSKDCTAIIYVVNPMQEPRIHRCIPGGLNDLEKYRSEFLWGIHDHRIDIADATKWNYTYSYRFMRKFGKDQIAAICLMLRDCGYTRRALISTWDPTTDLSIDDPPCLLNMWFRIKDGKLDMAINIRSNDGFKAGFMNMWASTELQSTIAAVLNVPVGSYLHVAYSYHIYGTDFALFGGMYNQMKERVTEQNVYTTEYAVPFLLDGLDELELEKDYRKEEFEELLKQRRQSLIRLRLT